MRMELGCKFVKSLRAHARQQKPNGMKSQASMHRRQVREQVLGFSDLCTMQHLQYGAKISNLLPKTLHKNLLPKTYIYKYFAQNIYIQICCQKHIPYIQIFCPIHTHAYRLPGTYTIHTNLLPETYTHKFLPKANTYNFLPQTCTYTYNLFCLKHVHTDILLNTNTYIQTQHTGRQTL